MRTLRRNVPLLLILILAAALRIHGIGRDSLWGDEMCTVMLARMNVVQLIRTNILWENIPPLHHLLLHVWIKVFGDSEMSVRIPSMLAGVASVAMIYVLARRLLGHRTALAAALLLAVLPSHIAYSQECRSYTLSVLLGLVATDAFVRLLRRPTQRLHALFILATALGLYAHLYALYTLLAQNVAYAIVLLRRDKSLRLKPRAWIADNLAAAALFGPWVPIVITWTRSVMKLFWVKRVTLDDIPRTYGFLAGSSAAVILLTAAIVIGVARWRRVRADGQARTGLILMLALFTCPIVVPVIVSVVTHPSFAPRYAIIVCVPMCILAAAGIAALRPRGLGAVALLAVALIAPWGTAAQIPREPWGPVRGFLEASMRRGDLAVVSSSGGARLYDYYVHRPDVPRRGTDGSSLPVTLPLESRHVWLVLYRPWYPLNVFLSRGHLRVERRLFTPDILVAELADDVADQPPLPLPPTPLPPPATSPSPTSATPQPSGSP